MRGEFKAFTCSRKISSPLNLGQLVLMYCNLDKSRQGVAGNIILLQERITDTAVQKRLSVYIPWLKALL